VTGVQPGYVTGGQTYTTTTVQPGTVSGNNVVYTTGPAQTTYEYVNNPSSTTYVEQPVGQHWESSAPYGERTTYEYVNYPEGAYTTQK
jgi:hypothetical protein